MRFRIAIIGDFRYTAVYGDNVELKVASLLVPLALHALLAPPRLHADIFSRRATLLWGAKDGTVVTSPDGSKKVKILAPDPKDADGYARILVASNGQIYQTQVGSWVNAEMGWAPDSKAFFVTYSDGGSVGRYHVKIVYVTESGLRISEPLPDGRKLFQPHCFDAEYPNVGAIKWTGPLQLLIAVEVPPHSSCASMGTFRAFKIELPSGNVDARYGQLAAKKLFEHDIGAELRGSNDKCVIKPQECIPPGLK